MKRRHDEVEPDKSGAAVPPEEMEAREHKHGDLPRSSAYSVAMAAYLVYLLIVRGGVRVARTVFSRCPRCPERNEDFLSLEFDPRALWWYCGSCMRTGFGRDLLVLLDLDPHPVGVVEEWLQHRQEWEEEIALIEKANELAARMADLKPYGVEVSDLDRN